MGKSLNGKELGKTEAQKRTVWGWKGTQCCYDGRNAWRMVCNLDGHLQEELQSLHEGDIRRSLSQNTEGSGMEKTHILEFTDYAAGD